MQPQSLFAFALLALTSASPVRRRQAGGSCARPAPVLPLTGADVELPAPEGLNLKYIALGHGIQNYSCIAGQEAKATGALAVLYDATALYPGQGPSSLPTVDHFDALTTTVLWAGRLPLKSDGATQFGADRAAPFPPAAPLEIPGLTLPFLGHHIFDAGTVPTFFTGEDEAEAELLIKAKLLQKVSAPQGADPGPVGTGAVAWLQLGDAGNSRGLSTVYRVVTAGGTAQPCVDDAPQSVPYTTYYWLYGAAE
ncbi:hypothetical protein B0T11DRAFT_100650 [Plectosphaerella cucumerina]|uniref:Malate dehydrogenase n=1 Tax=Plectosphaerella cucumerina TaxID=40658 RepID=A0A8K0TBZ8_9PEZI|nr:hypothetical protein B0T11DRAFT_100650 [Plectosphaerella cucumerina]